MICVELAFTADPRRLRARPAHRQRLAQLDHDGVLLAARPRRRTRSSTPVSASPEATAPTT